MIEKPPEPGSVVADADGSPSQGAPKDRPYLLSPQSYLENFRAAQSSISRSVIIALAIFAFWLAIENNYQKYNLIYTKNEKLKKYNGNIDQLAQRNQRIVAEVLFKESSLASDGAVSTSTISRNEQKNLDSLKKATELRDELAKQIETYRQEAVELSIAGTKLPSQPGLSPVLWLMALFCWLVYFGARRASAHRNLAAYFAALQPEDRAFGLAGEGSMWLAPLPSDIRLETGPAPLVVSRSELLLMLGWTTRTERRYRLALLPPLILLGFMFWRILTISLDFFSDFAVDNGVTHQSWRAPEIALMALLTIPCALFALTLFRRPRPTSDDDGRLLVSRRAFLGNAAGAAVGAAGALWLTRGYWTSIPTLNPSSKRPQNDVSSSSPRFLSAQAKARHEAGFNVNVKFDKLNTLVINRKLSRDQKERLPVISGLHYVSVSGNVRFFSNADDLRNVHGITEVEAIEWADRRVSSEHPRLTPMRTLVWELAALRRLESNEIDAACQLLMAGIRLTLHQTGRPNMRLVDLLAGVAVRNNKQDPYLNDVKQALGQRIYIRRAQLVRSQRQLDGNLPMPPIKKIDDDLTRWETRIANWSKPESRWYKRWTDLETPIWWHHPMERDDLTTAEPLAKDSPDGQPKNRQRRIRIT